MNSNKDLPSSWRKYQDGLCSSCKASCCTMPVEVKVEDLLHLGLVTVDEIQQSLKKTAKRLKKEGVITSYREGTDFFMLTQKSNEDCYFLDSKTRLCTVYDRRPNTCRDFPTRVGPRVGFCPYQRKG